MKNTENRTTRNVKIDMQDVRLQLMNKHAEFVEGDNLGVPGLLNPRQIAEYHHQVFNGLGLPSSTFGIIIQDSHIFLMFHTALTRL